MCLVVFKCTVYYAVAIHHNYEATGDGGQSSDNQKLYMYSSSWQWTIILHRRRHCSAVEDFSSFSKVEEGIYQGIKRWGTTGPLVMPVASLPISVSAHAAIDCTYVYFSALPWVIKTE